jgi:hypothetical protein
MIDRDAKRVHIFGQLKQPGERAEKVEVRPKTSEGHYTIRMQ